MRLLCATFHTLQSRRPTHGTSCRYDDGLQDITNIDFVEAVVRDMMRSNLRLRPRMRWLKMDMTHMDKARDRSFGTGIQRRIDTFLDTGLCAAHGLS